MRLIETPNADAKKFAKNAIVCAETDWKIFGLTQEMIQKTGCDSPEFITKKAQELLASHNIFAREDQVKVAMLMLAISPEFLRDGDKSGKLNNEKIKVWATGSLDYLKKTFEDRLLTAVIHMDETNPHMSAYVVPLIEKEVRPRGPRKKNAKDKPKESSKQWSLSCADLFTPDPYIKKKSESGKVEKEIVGKGTLSLMQDDYAEHLRKFGLDIRRGVRRAPHQKSLGHETNRLRYERLTAPIADISKLDDSELREWALDAAPLAEEAQRAKTERDHYQIAAAAAQEKADSLQNAILNSQRSLPVSNVIEKLFGIEPRQISAHELQFLLPTGQKISVNSNLNRFENLTLDIPLQSKAPRKNGKGAIDAVTLLTGWSTTQATEWIADNFDAATAKSAMGEIIETRIQLTKHDEERQLRSIHAQKLSQELERSDPEKWETVANTLEMFFKIPPEQFKELHKDNWLNANRFGHLICAKGKWDHKNDIVPTGKIIVDLDNPEIPLKETGDNGLVFMSSLGVNEAIVCSSPLDALALRCNPDHENKAIFVIGDPSPNTLNVIQRIFKAYKGNIQLAQNLSTTGKKIASWMKENFLQIGTLNLPEGFTTWIDYHMKQGTKKSKPHRNSWIPHLLLSAGFCDCLYI